MILDYYDYMNVIYEVIKRKWFEKLSLNRIKLFGCVSVVVVFY